ncbi:MAG: beta-ketoacyl-ACP synthase III [Proteobacteria bacterium]|nr:beta-ketoacyl-ACP synthase III [Pseudomonadota bacterium]
MKDVVISGTGLYNPPHIITNAELVESFNAYVALHNERHAEAIAAGHVEALQLSSVEFIEKASGIQRRHVIDKAGVLDPTRMRPRFAPRPDEQLSLMAELGVAGARDALRAAGKTGADIDGVLCAAANMQRAYPAMACEIQAAIGAKGYGFDMNVACSSATFGIEQAVNAVKSGSARCVLVVNPEITSAHLEWRDRDCHFIFGDVCTAVIVEAADTATSADRWRVLGTRLHTQFSNHIRNNAGFLNRCEDTDPDARDKTFRQEGRKVFKEVVPVAAAHIERHLADLGLKPAEVQRYWLHQANLGMNQLVVKKLLGDWDSRRAPVILDDYANTASAGSIIAFHLHHADMAAGERGVICSFGAGYSVGSVVVEKVAA